MKKDIFKVVRDLIESRDDVRWGSASDINGRLYDDSVENLQALHMLEPSLIELVTICVNGGIECKALDEVIELIGEIPL
jgi:hypothetical protein